MRRTAVIAVSVVAVLVAGSFLATSGGAQEQNGRTIKLVTKNDKFKVIDHRPRQRRGEDFGAGDQYTVSALAFMAGRRVGTGDAACTVTLGGKKGRGICELVYSLREGDIYLSARVTQSDTARGAVTGGTRAYAGARGTLKTVNRKGAQGA